MHCRQMDCVCRHAISRPWLGLKNLNRRHPHQAGRIFHGSVQPLVDILQLDGRHAPLVLMAGRQFGIRFVHARHQRVTVGVDRDHRVAFDNFPSILVGPGVPEASQAPGRAICAPEAPPDILAGFPTGLIEGPGRNDAALAVLPGLLVGGLVLDLLEAGIVGRVGELGGFGEERYQAPLTNDELARVGVGRSANERPWRPREDVLLTTPGLVVTDVPKLLNGSFVGSFVDVAHTLSLVHRRADTRADRHQTAAISSGAAAVAGSSGATTAGLGAAAFLTAGH